MLPLALEQATPHTALATAISGISADGPLQPVDAPDGDYNIQWMPPGEQDIMCWVSGQPRRLKFTVKAKHAELFNAQLQKMISRAQAGDGDRPFTDYNHEARAASSRPKRIEWGGNDPKTGGIRLIGPWTGKAKSAILDDEFDRFSPQWDFDENTGEPVGINENLGGLVNKPAFKSIAKVQANDASGAVQNDPATEPPGSFFNLVMTRAAQKKIPVERAVQEISREHPTLAEQYAFMMRGVTSGSTPFKPSVEMAKAYAMRGSTTVLALKNHPFLVQARALATAKGFSEQEAQIILAGKNYPLYQQFCASLHQAEKRRLTAAAADSGQMDFVKEVQTAQANGTSFDEAVNFVASSRPHLLDEYRRSFR